MDDFCIRRVFKMKLCQGAFQESPVPEILRETSYSFSHIYNICCNLTSFFHFPFNRRDFFLFESLIHYQPRLEITETKWNAKIRSKKKIPKPMNRRRAKPDTLGRKRKAWMEGTDRKAVGSKERNSRDESGAINKRRQTHACRSLLDFFSQLFYNSFMFLFWLEPALLKYFCYSFLRSPQISFSSGRKKKLLRCEIMDTPETGIVCYWVGRRNRKLNETLLLSMLDNSYDIERQASSSSTLRCESLSVTTRNSLRLMIVFVEQSSFHSIKSNN